MSNNRYKNTAIAWSVLFRENRIIDYELEKKGIYYISADTINNYREARLMTKFDHSINLPRGFKNRKLSILPVSRGEYAMGHFEAYHSFETTDSKPAFVRFPDYIQSINPKDITSEAIALNCAYASGIVEDFVGDEELVPTVSGRMKSGEFTFDINDVQDHSSRVLAVNNSQIEIDAAYEGLETLTIIEAKRTVSEDFLVRQLYYPFRRWIEEVDKKVKPIYLVYSNGILQFYEYEFEDPFNYNSLKLVKQKSYTWEDPTISVIDLEKVLHTAKQVSEPNGVPFPQADSFERVINLCELLKDNSLSKAAITDNYAFDGRQTDYYTNAGIYLGLIQKSPLRNNPHYSLTDTGKKILELDYRNRQLAFCKNILEHRVFHESLKRYFATGTMPRKEEIVSIMKAVQLANIDSEVTLKRRASTVRGWLDWIVSIISE